MNITFDKYTITPDDKITVITGNNGSGKTRVIEELKLQVGENNNNYLILDCDSHCSLNHEDLVKFVTKLQDASKRKQVIIASMQREIIGLANKVITLEVK